MDPTPVPDDSASILPRASELADHGAEPPRPPRHLAASHQEVFGEWHHLAIRSLLEMFPDPGEWASLGRRLVPPLGEEEVGESVKVLARAGLVELGEDRKWHASERTVSTLPEAGIPTVRGFHHKCLTLASRALENTAADRRNVSGLTLGISRQTYRLVCDRLTELREEIARLADADDKADQVYQLTLAFFPLSTDNSSTAIEDQP